MSITRFALCMAVCAACTLATGCVNYAAPVKPPRGGIFTMVKGPIDTDMAQTPRPATLKIGKATSKGVLGLFGWGDASIEKAAANGGLVKIHYADYEFVSYAGVYGTFTTVVYGE
ncbi:MAG: TRL-like family protein [Lentisphaeria bacterium]|nr:TRL-like family protein [Lentisphaeria bacterium]